MKPSTRQTLAAVATGVVAIAVAVLVWFRLAGALAVPALLA